MELLVGYPLVYAVRSYTNDITPEGTIYNRRGEGVWSSVTSHVENIEET